MEKPDKSFLCKGMREVSPPLFPGNLRRLNIGQASHVQKTNEAVYHIDPRPTGVVGFRPPLPAPAVNHFLCQCGSTRIIRVAVMVKQHQVFLIGRIIPSLGCLPVPYKAMDLWGKERTEFFHMDSTSFARGNCSTLRAHSFKCTKSALR